MSDYIAFTIDRFSKGYVFTFADFTKEVNQKEVVIIETYIKTKIATSRYMLDWRNKPFGLDKSR